MAATLDQILQAMLDCRGSDLHLKADRPPMFRIAGKIMPSEFEPLSNEDVQVLVLGIMTDRLRTVFESDWSVDFSYVMGDKARFRVNAFIQRGCVSASLRAVPLRVPDLKKLHLPSVLADIALSPSGLVLVTGPTGSGKSTTVASMLDHVNEHREAHIVTLEDPIEFVYQDKQSIVNQREIGTDVPDFTSGLKHVLRQDPDVILIGEMRDPETIEAAVAAAETGHLVFSTLHTNDAPGTIDRIVDCFEPEEQRQVRTQIAAVLKAVVTQKLVPFASRPGRVPAVEVMINSPQVQHHIADGQTNLLHRVIEESGGYYRMQTMNQSLALLLKHEAITLDAAEAVSDDPDELLRILRTMGAQAS
ncbi:MAG: type IV pilus twitching motility protein PilT [Armatimonadetes bacterium]|nr:type IV pilus twitching motility protein PilT [Armatimonadota bacterium]